MKIPLISVILPVYNCEEFLPEAIESILTQSFIDFEFLIIDDGSTDHTQDVIKKYASKDHRIQAILNNYNIGIALSLNIGLANSRSPLIARMDADDVALPDRLSCQYDFMQTHPEVSVCGSALQLYENTNIIWRPPRSHEEIITSMLFENCLFHPTILFRKDVILKSVGGYRSQFSGAEDYDLWQRLSKLPSINFSNIQDILLLYRSHPNTNRAEYKIKQQELSNLIRLRNLKRLNLIPNKYELSCHDIISYPSHAWSSPPSLKDCNIWLDRIESANKKYKVFSDHNLKKELETRWLKLCLNSANQSILTAPQFLNGRRYNNSIIYNAYQSTRMLWRFLKNTY